MLSKLSFKIQTLFNLERRLNKDSYVGTYHGEPERFEETLQSIGFKKNPLSWVKFNSDGYQDSSWVKRSSLFSNKQLHVIIQSTHNSNKTRIFVHREDNWLRHPLSHLNEENLKYDEGVIILKEIISNRIPPRKITYAQ